MSLADEIRAYSYHQIIKPQLQARGEAHVQAGDVHKALNYVDRVPAVVSALGGAIFQGEYKLTLVERRGRPVSTRTEFVFVTSSVREGDRLPAPSSLHIEALKWFEDRSGQSVPWAELNAGNPKRAILPKGIYRPAGWQYALSIKIMPGGPYADEETGIHNGRPRFRYHQEDPAGRDAAKYFTNVGLQNCMIAKIPVGVIRQLKAKPGPIYEVLGLGLVVDWQDSFFTIEFDAATADYDYELENGPDHLEPVSLEDARNRTAQSIVRRRGQAKFRAALLDAYDGRCVISGCTVEAVLEAAHIKPYLGDHTNAVRNGLLLRADLHTLFDLKKLRIEPTSRRVVIADELQGTEYEQFAGRILPAPRVPSAAPAVDCLEYAWSSPTLIVNGSGTPDSPKTVTVDR
jgi:hypothetical protein